MKAKSRTNDRFPIRPIVASPMPVYVSGVAMGIGFGVLVLLLLLGIA